MINNKDWINVNDREPAHKGLYITCDELGIVDLTQYDHGECGWLTDADSKVTHWMPLPDAPTEDYTSMDDHLLEVLDYCGIAHQSMIAMEELSELQKAISKAARFVDVYNLCDYPSENPYLLSMAEEIADVLICIKQMRLYYFLPDFMIERFICLKIDRSKERLKNARKKDRALSGAENR